MAAPPPPLGNSPPASPPPLSVEEVFIQQYTPEYRAKQRALHAFRVQSTPEHREASKRARDNPRGGSHAYLDNDDSGTYKGCNVRSGKKIEKNSQSHDAKLGSSHGDAAERDPAKNEHSQSDDAKLGSSEGDAPERDPPSSGHC